MLSVSARFTIILSLSGTLHLAVFSIQLPSRAGWPGVASPAVLQVRITQPSIGRPVNAAASSAAVPPRRVATQNAASAAKSGASSPPIKSEPRDPARARTSPGAFSSRAFSVPEADSESTPKLPAAGSTHTDVPPQAALSAPQTGAVSGDKEHEGAAAEMPSAPQAAIAAPRLAFSTPLRYPEEARWERRTGKTQLAFRLRPDGSPTAVELLASSGHEDLDAAAIEALRGWRFKVSHEVDPSIWFKYAIRFELL